MKDFKVGFAKSTKEREVGGEKFWLKKKIAFFSLPTSK